MVCSVDPWTDPPVIPYMALPDAPFLPPPVLEVPRADIPNYKPLVVPPNTLKPPPGIKGINTEDEPPKEASKPNIKPIQLKPNIPIGAQVIEVPFTDIEVTVPDTPVITTAATTAAISVAATLTATSVPKWLVKVFKPIIKQAWSKLTQQRNRS